MFTANPFAPLSASIPPAAMQAYVVAMIVLVVGGTLFDMLHKRSARYFFDSRRKAAAGAKRQVGAGEKLRLALQTAGEGLVSGEFCNARRRIAHLVTMYGFLAYAAATVILVFRYPTPAPPAPALVPILWHAGALMVVLGGCWFWFFIRVDVAAEGHSPFRLVRADLFIVALLKSTTLALIWSWLEAAGSPLAPWALGLYLIATTVLFGSVPWSKFSHMFYKPAAAFQKRLEDAGGTRQGLPPPADKPEIFPGIRRQPSHY